MRATLRTVFVALVVTLISGCSKPLPADKANYVGDWRSPEMRLLITPGGRIEYERRGGGGNKSIQAPIQRFEGNDFYAGLGMLSTRFVVLRPPTQESGVWKMTVDGVELTRLP